MSPKAYLRILQGGLLASLLITLFVFKDLLFPYITSKQLSFNILMEFLLAVWLVFILRYPEYRPKKNYITWGLAAFFIAILASCAVSVDFGLSFWGDAERMLGLFHIVHFFIFYLILITVFRTWGEWKVLFMSSVAVATVVSFLGLGGETISTIGNTAYVSGYLIFNIFFALILFWRARSGWRWLYVLPVLIMLWEFWACHTSGAIIGLAFSALLLVLLLGLFHKNKVLRQASLSVFIIALIGVIAIFSQYKSAWFQNSFLRNLTTQKVTFQTRLISWQGAAKDFKNHWLFGTGFGNYAIIFDKYFDSKFFNYTKTETYFDRAHNNLIDIASTTGLVGLLAYLSIFVAVGYYLVQEFKRNGGRAGQSDEPSRRNLEILIIVALLAAYFIQNLAVFDSFVTYIGLMIVLAYIYSRPGELQSEEAVYLENEEVRSNYRLTLSRQWEWTTLIACLLLAYLFAYQYNIRAWRMFDGVIQGYSQISEGNFALGVQAYQAALQGSALDHDGAVTLINLITSNPNLLDTVMPKQAQEILDYTISLAEKNVAGNPFDSLMQMQLAQIYDTAARYNYKDIDKFNYYSSRAIEAIDRAIEASPGRAPIYLVKAQMQLIRGERKEAIETAKYAISLNTAYDEGYCRLAQFYIFIDSSDKKPVKDDKTLGQTLDSCIDLGGAGDINSGSLLISAFNYFTANKDYPRAVKAAERLAQLNDQDPQAWLNLAKIYLAVGDAEGAQNASQKAIDLDPSYKTKWADFLKGLQGEATGTPSVK